MKQVLRAIWNERSNFLSLLNTFAIAAVACVLWIQIPNLSKTDSSKPDDEDGLSKLTERLDHPLSFQSDSLDKLSEILDHPLHVVVSNGTSGGVLDISAPFKVDATVDGKISTTLEGNSELDPIHVSNP